jgi:hypothetical protein
MSYYIYINGLLFVLKVGGFGLKMIKQQEQVIFGSLLGNAYIVRPKLGKNSFLAIPEKKNKDWLAYKAFIINKTKNKFIKDTNRLIWRSPCDCVWNQFYNQFYNKKKTIRMDILDRLYNIALSTWFLDKGFFLGTKICLRTTAFGWEGNEVIARYFNEVGIPCKIRKERNTGKILFTEEGTRVFIDTIINEVPKFMLYRLEPQYKGR